MKEGEPKFDEKEWKKSWKRVGLELDDEQLSQIPNPQVKGEQVKEEKAEKAKGKEKKMKLGSFWEDRY